MATSRIDPVTDFAIESDESDVEVEFVDEDDLPLSCVHSGNNFLEHPESDEEVGSDFLSDSGDSEAGEGGESEDDEELETDESIWTEELTTRTDIDFNQAVGMAVDPASLKSSKDFFELFFTDQVWQLLATQTNLYASQKRGPEENSVWYPVSVEEMKAWLALYLCMGIVNKPNIKSYWSTDPILSTPFFPATMSRTRFVQILRYLHFADNNLAPRPDSPDYNKLYKIQPVLDLVVPRFKAVYHPKRELAVDETLIKFKGRVHFRQFIPSKPGRFGIKAFTLAESTSGYVLGSKVYTGKEAGVVQKDLGKKAVMSLMEPFLGKGYYLFMDNYYTSVGLFEELEERSTLACGTVRSNRVDLPKEICNLKSTQVKQLKRGESLYRQKGTLTCVTWRDRKVVSMLATLPTGEEDSDEVERSVKVNGHWQKKNFARPGVINLYNTFVGGVDVADQRVSTYARLMRGSVWYYKLFFYVVEVCISNAHILENKSLLHTTRNGLLFRRSLIDELIQQQSFRRDTRSPQNPIPQIRFNQGHFHHLVSHKTRSTCKVHLQRVDTTFSCAVCGVRMCQEPCFQRYHTLRDYYYNDEEREGPRRLKEGRGRPRARGRARTLQN